VQLQALAVALKDYGDLEAAQGKGKSLRVPARTRIIDDVLLKALQERSNLDRIQVVSLGAGDGTID